MNELLTVSSLTATAATGAVWPRSCLTKTNSFRSQMIHVRSRDPLTMILYAGDADRQVTASLWPNRDFFRVRRRRWRPLPNSHTFTTCHQVHACVHNSSWKPTSEPRSDICHMGSSSISCHPTKLICPTLV